MNKADDKKQEVKKASDAKGEHGHKESERSSSKEEGKSVEDSSNDPRAYPGPNSAIASNGNVYDGQVDPVSTRHLSPANEIVRDARPFYSNHLGPVAKPVVPGNTGVGRDAFNFDGNEVVQELKEGKEDSRSEKSQKSEKDSKPANVSKLKIPSECRLKKGELENIKKYIEKNKLNQEDAQRFLEAENDGAEVVYVKANKTGYYETQRIREGEKFYAKKKYLPAKWLDQVDEKGEKRQQEDDSDEMVRPSFDGRSRSVI